MPLSLNSNKIDYTAALTPNEPMKRYEVRTLKFPNYGYAYARAVVKNRSSFIGWMDFNEEELISIDVDEEQE